MPALLLPSSVYPVNPGRVFHNLHIGKGSNSKQEYGLGVMASLSSNSQWEIRFPCPPVIPSETMKFRILGLADAQSGAAKINPGWTAVSAEGDPSASPLQFEGTETITWSTGDDDVYKEHKWSLATGNPPTSNDIIIMQLDFVSSGWSLAKVSTWLPSIIWE